MFPIGCTPMPTSTGRELDLIFGGPSWSYVALAAELPGPGDFVRTSIGETRVIVTRARDGQVHVLVNRCAHRGVMFRQARFAGRGRAPRRRS